MDTTMEDEDKTKSPTVNEQTCDASDVLDAPDVQDVPDEDIEILPDRSMNDYYCKLCDSHMNNEEMWKTHVSGRRHLKNLKKGPDDESAQANNFIEANAKPLIQDELDAVILPIVGLDYACEVQPANEGYPATYSCYLCRSSMRKHEFIPHMTSMRHRQTYLKQVDPDGYELIEGMQVRKKDAKEALVADKVREIEERDGRKQITVKVERMKTDTLTKLNKRLIDSTHPGLASKKRYMDNDSSSRRYPQFAFNPKDIRHFNIDTKLRMLEELSQCEIYNDAEANAVERALDLLSQCLMQSQIRLMAPHDRIKLTRGLLSGGGSGFNSGRFPYEQRSDGDYWQQPNFSRGMNSRNNAQFWTGYR